MIFDEIQVELERQAEELEIEHIDPIDHFARRIGVTRDDLMEFLFERARDIYKMHMEGKGVEESLMSGYFDALLKGYALGRRKRGSPT